MDVSPFFTAKNSQVTTYYKDCDINLITKQVAVIIITFQSVEIQNFSHLRHFFHSVPP